ncbi:hypothetical protein HLV37_00590 [Eggerthellaceae bacterium zg-1084]|uniref:Abi family protein n=1 Tax=Berryella wangjianweii TaxID=2734634 RepID=UPI0015572EAD|nr:Abi family protein [Berryella wangjianweii]NPD30387.1 hypothetical protein [Berryella wangjianweii]
MSGRRERVYMRLTPGEKDRALDLASRNGLTVSQPVRALIQLPADYASEGACTAVVLDRATAGEFEREMRRWGNHYNQAAHTLNRIAYYAGGYPVWVFLEVIDFGTFADLWRHCALRWDSSEMRAQHYVLKSVRALRNACAHNSLIVNGFSRRSERTSFNPPRIISASLNERGMKNTKARRSKLANLRVSQIAATLYADGEFCMRDSTRARHAAHLAAVRHYAENCGVLRRANDGIVSYFDFVWKLVDIWLPSEY